MTAPGGRRRSLCALLAAAGAMAPAAASADDGLRAPARDTGATTAQIVAATHARAKPGLERRRLARLDTRTGWSRHAQRVLVLDSARRDGRQWLEVLLATRPNGSTGWIPRDKAALGHTPYWIELRLRTRRLSVYRDGHRIRRFRAVIGAPGTPTPRGLAAIYERNVQPDPRRVPRTVGALADRVLPGAHELRGRARPRRRPRPRCSQPARSAGKRAITRLRPHRQRARPLARPARRTGNPGAHQALRE